MVPEKQPDRGPPQSNRTYVNLRNVNNLEYLLSLAKRGELPNTIGSLIEGIAELAEQLNGAPRSNGE